MTSSIKNDLNKTRKTKFDALKESNAYCILHVFKRLGNTGLKSVSETFPLSQEDKTREEIFIKDVFRHEHDLSEKIIFIPAANISYQQPQSEIWQQLPKTCVNLKEAAVFEEIPAVVNLTTTTNHFNFCSGSCLSA